MCGRARRAPRAERESVTSLRQGPRSPPAITSSRKPDPKTRVQSASPRALRRRSTNHIETQESSDKSPHTHTYSYTRHGRVHGCRICGPQKHFITLTTHGHRVERRRRRQRHTRADKFGRGGAATAWAAAALSARACRLPSLRTARARSGQGSVAARGNAAAVAAAAAAAARAGGLIRTGRSDRLGSRRRSRRKLSIYVQKPLGRVCCCAVCSRKTNGCLSTS